MPKWFKIYSRSNPPCEWCQKAKELLQVYGKDYYEIDISEPGVRDFFKVSEFKTVPQVFVEEEYIGGYEKLEEYLRREQEEKRREHYRNKSAEDFGV